MPPVKERLVTVNQPDATAAEGMATAKGALLHAVPDGDLMPG